MGKKAAQHDFREQAAGGSLYMGACEWVLPEPRVRTRLDCRLETVGLAAAPALFGNKGLFLYLLFGTEKLNAGGTADFRRIRPGF